MFYIIIVSEERSAWNGYIATSREECEKHIMEFANFWSNPGTCSIQEIDNNFKIHKSYTYREGKLVDVNDYEGRFRL